VTIHDLLHLKKAWGILTAPTGYEPVPDGAVQTGPRCRKGIRLFPTLEEAREEYDREGGVDRLTPRRWYGPAGPTKMAIYEFELPHCWMYDTEPHHEGWYYSRLELRGTLVHTCHGDD
jgi:hypothetical protein